MKTMHIVPLLLLFATGALAQTPAPIPFFIGAHGFAPQWDSTVFRLHFVQGKVATAIDENQRLHFLTDRHFQAASDLGLNLASIVVDPNLVLTDPANPNVIRQVCTAAATTVPSNPMYVSITDWNILTCLAGERIMLHPEYDGDFSVRGSYTHYTENDFNNIPLLFSNLSTPLTETAPSSNCVVNDHRLKAVASKYS